MGLGTAVAYLTLDATGFARGIDAAMVDAQRLNTGFRNVSNMATYTGETMTGVGKVLTAGITAPVLGFGAASIKSGAEFDKSMSDVRAVSMNTKTDMDALSRSAEDLGVSYQKGTTDADTAFNALRATAIKMGNDTKFTAKESADALYYMGLAGWSADQMIAGIPAVLSLASAGNTELATTSDIVTDAITGFGHSADESVNIIRGGFNKEIPVATRLADIMASTMANSNTDVDMLGQSFKYVSPIAGAFGYSMEDISLSLGLMANAGVKASQAGTTLRQGLKRLVAPTDKAQEVMDKYNWSVADAQGNIKPLRQQLDELRGIFGDLDIEVMNADGTMKTSEEIMQEYGKKLPITQQEKLSDAVQVFGTTALPGMLALMGASQDSFDNLASAIDNSSAAFVLHNGEMMTYKDAVKEFGEDVVTTSDAFDVLGSSEGMAMIQLDNLQGDWTLFKSALGTTKQIISDMANGPLRELVQGLTDLVRKFNEMSPEQQKMIVKFGLIAAAVGPVLIGVGKLITGLGRLQGAMQMLTGVGTPVYNLFGRLATRVANVREGFALAQAGFPALGREASLLGSKLGTVTTAFTTASTAAGGGFTGALAGAKAALAAFFTPVVIVIAVIGTLIAAFVHLMKTNEEFKEKVVGKFKELWDNLQGYFQQIVDAVNSLGFNFKDIADMIAGAWDGLCNALAPILQGLVTLITSAIDSIMQTVTGVIEVISGVVGLIKGIITGDGEQIKTSVKVLVDGIVSIFTGIGKFLLSPFLTLFETINGIFGTELPTTFDEFGNVVSGMADVVVGAVGKAVDWIKSIPEKVTGFFESVGQFFTDLWSTITTALSNIGTAISDWASSVVEWFKQLPTNILNFMLQVAMDIAVFVYNLRTKAQEIGSGFIDKVVNFFSELPYNIGYAIGSAIGHVVKFVYDLKMKANEIRVKFVRAVIKFFNELPGKIKKTFDDIVSKVKQWVSTMVSKAKEVGNKFVDNVVNFFKQLPTKVNNFITDVKNKISKWGTSVVSKGKETGSKFLTNIVNFFKQLPTKIGNFIDTTKKKVVLWANLMVDRAKFTGGRFIHNITLFFKQLPSKIWKFLTDTIKKVATFVTDMGKKGKEAATELKDKFLDAAKNLPSKVMSVGKDIVEGVWKGISNAANWLKEKVSGFFTGIVDGVKDVLGIHSPSKVFEKQVGLNIVLGVAKGITENSKHAENAAKYMMNKVISATGIAYDKQYNVAVDVLNKTQKEIDKIQKQITNTTDKEEKKRLKKQLANLKERKKNQKQAITDLQSDYLQYCENQLSQETTLYNYSNKQIVQYWKNVRSHLKKGTAAYEEATQKIIDAQVRMYSEMVSEADDNLSKMKKIRDVSLAEEIQYWENVRKHCLVGSKAYEDATDKINTARKEFNDKTKEANDTLKEGIKSVADTVKQKVQEITDSYNNAVASTKQTLMGLSGLFESFAADEAVSGDDLVNNLQSQVDGLEKWNGLIDKMFSRGLPQDLIDELQDMGPKAMGSIENLLNMTDEQLNEYVNLWQRKNSEAQRAATKMVDKTPYTQEIQDTVATARTEVEQLIAQYNESLAQLGIQTEGTALSMATQFSTNFTTSLEQDLANTDFSFIGDVFSEEDFSSIGTNISNSVNDSVVGGLQNVASNSVDAMALKIQEKSPVVIKSVQSAIDAKKVNVTAYVNKGVEVVKNIITGVKRHTPALNAQMFITGKQSQDNFIRAIKSKEPEVYNEGAQIGKQLDDGMAAGIEQYVGSVIAAAVAAVQAAIAAARAAAAISSPSKVMANQVGKWLPLGMAKGFVDYIPEATNKMQGAIDESLDSLQASEVDIFPNVKNVGDEVRDAFRDISSWFSDVSNAVTDMTDTMKYNIQDVVDMTDGMLYNVYDGGTDRLNNLISGRNTTTIPANNIAKDSGESDSTQTTNTFIFNSPKPIDEVQASRLIRQTSRNLAEGFG